MKIAAIPVLIIAIAVLILGCLSLAMNSLEAYPALILLALFLALTFLYVVARLQHKEPKKAIIVVAVISLASAIILRVLPEYLHGLNFYGVIHRSIISAILLIALGVPATCYSLFYLLGATPRAYDLSRYPLLIFPILLVLSAYVLIIVHVVTNGAPQLSWSMLVTPFKYQIFDKEVWQNGWPTFVQETIKQIGIRNHILGTFLIMGLTSLISLPVGMGVGIFICQYAGPKLGAIIKFSTTALRAISGIILALVILSLTKFVDLNWHGSILNYILSGFGYYANGTLLTGRSSFLIASIFISLLVIPIIARATEEGIKSLPPDIAEGSLAVGASPEHTLTHISIPWSLPNIITGLVLGCAEAAGALTIIFLVAGTGELGVTPLSETTSLGYLIFDCRFSAPRWGMLSKILWAHMNIPQPFYC